MEETDIGSLEAGKCADFIAIDMNRLEFAGALHDPLAAFLFCNPVKVDVNVVGGKFVVKDGELQTLDLPTHIEKHNQAAARLIGRIEILETNIKENESPFHRLQRELGERIASAEPGENLPPEPELARQMGVSRSTLREAMRSFEAQGLLMRRQGAGTFVVEKNGVFETGLEVLESLETIAERQWFAGINGWAGN